MNYGYARVSTREQNEERQIAALQNAGIEKYNIYLDKQSGKDFDRVNYKKLFRRVKVGDVIYIKSIDRLGRNYEEIIDQWRKITKEKHVDIVVLDMPLLDTRTTNDITGTVIADIVLQLLSYVAQKEREFIKQRQREGIDLALKRGVKFGRRPIRIPENYYDIKQRYQEGKLSSRQAGELLGISHKTFLNWVNSK